MTGKPTPGPWATRVRTKRDLSEGHTRPYVVLIVVSRDVIGEMLGLTPEEALANASIAAAAPEMYVALKSLLLVHRQQDSCGVLPADKGIAYGKVEAAIARAEGR